MLDVEGRVGVSTRPGGAPAIEGVGVVTGEMDGPMAGLPGRFSPTPAAKMLPFASIARAVISFLGALYRTKASPVGAIRYTRPLPSEPAIRLPLGSMANTRMC